MVPTSQLSFLKSIAAVVANVVPTSQLSFLKSIAALVVVPMSQPSSLKSIAVVVAMVVPTSQLSFLKSIAAVVAMVVPTSQLSFLKSIAALVFSIGSSLTMHCLLLLSLSLAYLLQLLPSFSISALVTGAAFVAAAFIDISLATLQRIFLISFPIPTNVSWQGISMPPCTRSLE